MSKAKKSKSKILLRQVRLKGVFRGLAFFLVFLLCFVTVRSTQSSPAPFSKKAVSVAKQKPAVKIDLSLPARLTIPKLKVDAVVESVGLAPDGAVGVPKGPVNAAWYNLGPRPGDVGSSVITGHYGYWKSGVQTIFNNLSKLRAGDKIYVKNKQGVTTTFVVREIKSYGPKDSAPEVFFSNDDQAHLNLITCQGAWNKVTKSFPKRLVVFTDKE
jgi:LPXTG-site transpeptidase (sortase) family protein